MDEAIEVIDQEIEQMERNLRAMRSSKLPGSNQKVYSQPELNEQVLNSLLKVRYKVTLLNQKNSIKSQELDLVVK